MSKLQIKITRAFWHKVLEEQITYYEPILEGTMKNKDGADIPVSVHFRETCSSREEAEKEGAKLLASFV